MTYIVNNASLSMYADDHQLYVKGKGICVRVAENAVYMWTERKSPFFKKISGRF